MPYVRKTQKRGRDTKYARFTLAMTIEPRMRARMLAKS